MNTLMIEQPARAAAPVRVMLAGLVSMLVLMAIAPDAEARHRFRHFGRGPVVQFWTGPVLYPPYPYYHQHRIGRAPAPVETESQAMYVYPARGQDNEQQARDQFECYQWAADESGFDPAGGSAGRRRMVTHSAPPPDGLPDDPLVGAAGGAALGAAGGAAAGDAGTGAAVGAAVGLIAGIMGQSNNARHATRTMSVSSGDSAAYRRAFATCLSARGYQVG